MTTNFYFITFEGKLLIYINLILKLENESKRSPSRHHR